MWCIGSTRNSRSCARVCAPWLRNWTRAKVRNPHAHRKRKGRRTTKSARRLLGVEKLRADRLVLEDFLAREPLQFMRKDQPVFYPVHTVVRLNRAAIAVGLV